MCLINFTKHLIKVCLSLHYIEANSYLFVKRTEIHKFKAKISEIVATPLCLGNVSKDFSAGRMNKIRFNGHIYNFSVGYDDAIAVDDTLSIHKYLMKKNDIV